MYEAFMLDQHIIITEDYLNRNHAQLRKERKEEKKPRARNKIYYNSAISVRLFDCLHCNMDIWLVASS